MSRAIMILIRGAAVVVLMLPVLAGAQVLAERPQDLLLKDGEHVFSSTCTGYCHGEKGGPGAAPRLANRGFDAEYIEATVTYGIAGTPMKSFGTLLPSDELKAVIAYVKSLNGITFSPDAEAARPQTLPPQAAAGKKLFFDETRGLGRCSTCHQIAGVGLAVAKPIRTVPADVTALRELATPELWTATVKGDKFPALPVMQGREETKLYDLTKPPPVLRTFATSEVSLSQGSSWRHESVTSSYSRKELESILIFVQAAVRP